MKYVYAKRIVDANNVENSEAFLIEKTLQIGLNEKNLVILRGKAHVILDFGKELSGGARILTHAAGGKKTVRLRFGESVSETCSESTARGYGFSTNDHSNRDFYVDLQNYSDMTFAQTGFRFLRIDTTDENAEIRIKTVVAAVDTDEREALGSFTCDDPLVNQIWDTAAYTIRLCLQNGYFWDGIKRDRLVWIGDLYPEMRAAHCLFGDVIETENSLEYAKAEAPLPVWMNNIATYSLWWLIILADEYLYSGDKEKFLVHLPYIKDLLQQISDHVNADGSTSYGWDFIDWPSCYVDGAPEQKRLDSACGVGYLTKVAMQKIQPFLMACKEDISLCKDILARLDKKERTVGQYKQIAAIGVWSGEKTENNKEVLLRDGAKGLSTFMSYPILTSVAEYGEYETALNMMKEFYGGMLSVGATTFWEDFDLDWLENCGRIDEMHEEGKVDIHGDKGAHCYVGFRHSLCHGWSAGVIPYIVETVAGIHLDGVGGKKLRIAPRLSGLKHVKVDYPTVYGIVTVEHTLQENGEIKTLVFAPQEIEVVVE